MLLGPWRSRWCLVAGCSALVTLAACEASGGPGGGPGGYSAYPLIDVRGRAVSLESCFDISGCAGVEGLTISLLGDPDRVSPATARSGSFVIERVPAGVYLDLVASQGGGARDWAPTINARVVEPSSDDVFDVDVYVLPRDPLSLLEAWRTEEASSLEGLGGVVVLVVAPDPERPQQNKAIAGARVELFPAPTRLRYVNVVPRFVGSTGAEEPFLDADADATGPFGLAVATWATPPDTVVAVATDPDHVFEVTLAEVRAGRVSFALVRGAPVRP